MSFLRPEANEARCKDEHAAAAAESTYRDAGEFRLAARTSPPELPISATGLNAAAEAVGPASERDANESCRQQRRAPATPATDGRLPSRSTYSLIPWLLVPARVT